MLIEEVYQYGGLWACRFYRKGAVLRKVLPVVGKWEAAPDEMKPAKPSLITSSHLPATTTFTQAKALIAKGDIARMTEICTRIYIIALAVQIPAMQCNTSPKPDGCPRPRHGH
jgi:hypothetical protein